MKSSCPSVIVIDFETHAIEPRPQYPPKPVSLAVKWPDQREYKLMAWGHGDGSRAAGNNCAEKEARSELTRVYASKYPILAQNFAFDGDVAETHWGLKLPSWDRFHDTLFLAFLNNPHSPTLALKPLAELLLGIPPEEQDQMYEWIIANVPEATRKPSTAGAYIWKCPYQIVKPYHKGDLTRTLGLFNHLYPLVIDAGMGEAYDRERKLMPILLRNAREGMHVDVDGLERDLPLMKQGVEKADAWLRHRLGDINIDSDRQLAEALLSKGAVSELARTPKGQFSVSKKTLTIDKFKDKQVYQALTYRSQMSTSISMFMGPWIELAQSDGLLHGDWSQVRSPKGDRDDTKGARSGRIICSKPNLLNIPKKWKKSITAGYVHPEFLKAPELPFMRKYVLPDKGQMWGRRDFNQQELRLFGHFEDGEVMQGFNADPVTRPCPKCGAPGGRKCIGSSTHKEREYDIHELARAEEERALVSAGLRDSFDRDSAKTTVFGRVYGQGITGLMQSMKLSEEERPVAKLIQAALNRAIPSIGELDKQLKALAKDGRPIRTWGGRLYYCEPPKYSEKFGRDMTFEYKLLNYLCQGSGADVTKEVLVRWADHPKRRARFVVSVYDEIDVSCSKSAMREEMKLLRDVMMSIETDVPMLSDGETGPNWGTLEAWKD